MNANIYARQARAAAISIAALISAPTVTADEVHTHETRKSSALNCKVAVIEIEVGAAITQNAMINTPCITAPTARVYFQRSSGALIAKSAIKPGDYLGRISALHANTMNAGTNASLVIRRGHVEISRDVVLQSPTKGDGAFVSGDDGTVFRVAFDDLYFSGAVDE